MDAKKEILDAIEVMVNQAIEDSTTKIYTGICKILYTDKCVVTVNGKDNTVKYYGGIPVTGNSYRVFVPFGNMSAAFIIVPGINKEYVAGVVSVNGKSGPITLGASDVGALPDTTVIPTKTSQLANDSGFITDAQAPVKSVDGKTGNVVTNAVTYTQQILTEDQKLQTRTNIGAGTSSFNGDYNALSNLPFIPTATSQLQNDSGYITSDALAPYAKTNSIPTKVSQLENDNGYVNEGQAKNAAPVQSVNGKTGNIAITASDIGALPNTTTIPTNNNQLANGAGYITAAQAPVTSVNGMTGAVTIETSGGGFKYLGLDIITNSAYDTTAKWVELGPGYAFFSPNGQLVNKPSDYGFILNYVAYTDVFQIWSAQNIGPIYYRNGNVGGWGNSWRKFSQEVLTQPTQPSGQQYGALWFQT